jgi:hypothetical protein
MQLQLRIIFSRESGLGVLPANFVMEMKLYLISSLNAQQQSLSGA